MDKILVSGVKAWGKHGVLNFEREYSQPFTVDLEIWADVSKSYLTDDLQDTVNYVGVYDIVRSVVETQSYMLIERLSYVIMEKIFLYDSRIQRIKICVVKNKAPLIGQFDHVGVEIEKSRHDVLIQDTYTKSETGAGYKVVLALGTNIGDRKQNIQKALELLSDSLDVMILSKSKLYETEPVGYVNQEKFYNAAILVETTLNPFELYNKIKTIENNLGREKTFKWGPRVIDIDIIVYEGCIINTNGLTLPHKEYMQRAFVLKPLSDMPDAVKIAGLNMTIIEKMICCADDYHGINCVGSI
ncbi:MAG: 2-amino-4-hydroxy-6-hydroxymethyldihydropteridine diphosphokinase [Candidatus Bathyarchaeota archaeon]|nr:2-amino-4-hydroxy-6-hydroxymethyldihydropteridine diphosphokinase [Candidatus Termiticorpusculum sp.]